MSPAFAKAAVVLKLVALELLNILSVGVDNDLVRYILERRGRKIRLKRVSGKNVEICSSQFQVEGYDMHMLDNHMGPSITL